MGIWMAAVGPQKYQVTRETASSFHCIHCILAVYTFHCVIEFHLTLKFESCTTSPVALVSRRERLVNKVC